MITGSVLRAAVQAATLGDNELVAAVAGQRIRVLSGMLVASGGANTVRLESDPGGDALTGLIDLPADGQLPIHHDPIGAVETNAGEALNLELAAGTAVAGWINYVLES